MKSNLMELKATINFDQQEQIKKLTERFELEISAKKIEDCCKTLRWIDASVNEKLIFEQLLLNIVISGKAVQKN